MNFIQLMKHALDSSLWACSPGLIQVSVIYTESQVSRKLISSRRGRETFKNTFYIDPALVKVSYYLCPS